MSAQLGWLLSENGARVAADLLARVYEDRAGSDAKATAAQQDITRASER
jgi:hypothetical protein